MNETGIIRDTDEIYFYFQMPQNVGAESILDAGMFLKRIGAVSRQIRGCEIPENVRLYGIDYFPETRMAVYGSIYDEILSREEFFQNRCMTWKQLHFDIAVLLETEAVLSEEENGVLWNYALQNADAIMADVVTAEEQMKQGRIKGYYPVSVGTKSYVWIPLLELRGECK